MSLELNTEVISDEAEEQDDGNEDHLKNKVIEEPRRNENDKSDISSTSLSVQQQSKTFVRRDGEFLTWHKINVYTHSGYSKRHEIFQKIQDALGFPVKFFVWNRLSSTIFEFYVKGRPLANAIGSITSIHGITFKVIVNSINPPTARLSPTLKQKLSDELTSRFNPNTGHLNLSNFAETNNLNLEYWLPFNKPLIRATVNEIIMLNDTFKNITSVDLSYNRLNSFEDLDFLKHKSIKILIASGNEITSVNALLPLQALELTELDLQNNPLEKVPSEGGEESQPYDYRDEIKKIFPNLLILNPEPLGPTKRPLDDSNDHLPNKMSKTDDETGMPQESTSFKDNNNKFINDTMRLYTASHVIALERQLTETSVQIKSWSVMVQELNRRQQKTENNLKRMQTENLKLKNEVENMKGQMVNMNQMISQYRQPSSVPLPKKSKSSQMMRSKQVDLSNAYQYERRSNELESQPQHDYNYQYPSDMARRPDPSSETLADISHLFDRPARNN